MWTIGQLASLTGVTVRTLHHYDEIGLLRPSARSEAGYRLYDRDDLERLQEILVDRALGFPLEEIRERLDDPAHDRLAALRRRRALLAERVDELSGVLALVDATIAAHEQEVSMEPERLFEGFDPAAYEEEARARWGATPEYAESRRRTTAYSAADWDAIRAEADAIGEAFAALERAGAAADGPEARALAERHRAHISRWFYDCSPEIHRGLGELYLGDARFQAWWDRFQPGLAVYVRSAFAAAAGPPAAGRARLG
jgi:DNA-binding transcriptional MerR regulator